MNTTEWTKCLRSHRRRMAWTLAGLSAFGVGLVVLGVVGGDLSLGSIVGVGGFMVLSVVVGSVAARVVPVCRPYLERTRESWTVVVFPPGRFAMVTAPMAMGFAVSSYAGLTSEHWQNPIAAIVGLPLAVTLLVLAPIQQRYVLEGDRFSNVVTYGRLTWVREVVAPDTIWNDSRSRMFVDGDCRSYWIRRGKAGVSKSVRAVNFGWGPLPDELATTFVAEAECRAGVDISYGVMPQHMWDGH